MRDMKFGWNWLVICMAILVAIMLCTASIVQAQDGYPAPPTATAVASATARPTSTTADVVLPTATMMPPMPTVVPSTEPPMVLPPTGESYPAPFAGMTLAEALLFATSSAGAAVVIGIAWSYLMQVFPQFAALKPRHKFAAVAGLSLVIPVSAALLRGLLGYTPLDAELIWQAAWAGFVSFMASQAMHNARKTLRGDSQYDAALRLLLRMLKTIAQQPRPVLRELVEELQQEDAAQVAVGNLLESVLVYLDIRDLEE